jgi:hypothetical protein
MILSLYDTTFGLKNKAAVSTTGALVNDGTLNRSPIQGVRPVVALLKCVIPISAAAKPLAKSAKG